MIILIIEDDAGTAELLRGQLEACGYEASSAPSAADALAYLQAHSPDLVILDYSLPDMNGRAFVERMKVLPRPLPAFIVVTGQGDERIAVDMMQLGARDYLIKDIHLLDRLPGVVRRVAQELENERRLKRAEDALKASEARYRALYENTPSMYFTVDADGMVLSVNRFGAGQLGYTADQLVGQSLWYVFHPEDRETIQQGLAACFQNPARVARWELRKVRQDGSWFWVKEVVQVVLQPDGALVAFIVSQDITERKRMDEKLQRYVEQMAIVVEIEHSLAASLDQQVICENLSKGVKSLMPDVSTIFISGFDVERQMIFAMYAEQDGEAVNIAELPEIPLAPPGKGTQSQVIHSRQPLVIVSGVQQKLRKETVVRVGSTKADTQSALYVPMLAQDRVLGIIQLQSYLVDRFTDEDIRLLSLVANTAAVAIQNAWLYALAQKESTERQQAEKQLRQQERLAAVGQLAAGIAHDFRNLLTAIILYAQISLGEPDLPPKVVRSLEVILGESKKAADLVQQMLDFSRRSMIEVRPLELKAFTEEVIGILQRTIPESIRLTLTAEAGAYVVMADSGRLQQALLNLALNSRDAMPQGGELRFDLSRVQVEPGDPPPVADMPAGEWVCLAVADTGAGMKAEVRDHLFEPFFTTKEVGKGTGLGLAQVYGIVRQHEGYIDVESAEGSGTTSHIYLPVARATPRVVEEPAARPPRGRGETILLVEDNDSLREVGRRLLEALGYRVLTAADGRQALEVYQAQSGVQLVITDVVMPEMGGQQLVHELRRVAPHLKIVGITGYALKEGVEELRQEGFVELIQKPFEVKALARAVRQALDAE